MEKLIEYYNEYYQKKNLKEYYDYIKDMVLPEKFDSLIFLKDFCKWLVENNKIDLKKLYKKEIESGWDFDGPKINSECLLIEFANQCNTEIALMLLSISEKPIELLISILK